MRKLLAVFVSSLLLFAPLSAFAAIAFDASNSSLCNTVGIGTCSTTLTVATGGILVGTIQWNGSSLATSDISGCTFNGVSLTKDIVAVTAAANQASATWHLLNPTTGSSQTLTCTSGKATVNRIAVFASSYTGANTSSQPDSTGSLAVAACSTGTQSIPITVGTTGSWLVSTIGGAVDAAFTGNNLTRRQDQNSTFDMGDTNGTIATGAQHAIWNSTCSGGSIVGTVISIKPPTAVVTVHSLISILQSWGF